MKDQVVHYVVQKAQGEFVTDLRKHGQDRAQPRRQPAARRRPWRPPPGQPAAPALPRRAQPQASRARVAFPTQNGPLTKRRGSQQISRSPSLLPRRSCTKPNPWPLCRRSRRRAYPDLPPVEGVRFATAEAGIRYKGRTDVMLALFDKGTEVAGVFTQSKCPSAPVDWCRAKLNGGKARALVVNSGNANAFTGKTGSNRRKLTASYRRRGHGRAAG